MAFSPLPLSTLAVAGSVLTLFYLLYRAALPRPIPGIPYNKASAKRIFGDIPAMAKHMKEHSQVFDWMVSQCVELNSPIVQIFARPFARPFVIMSDFREGQDILMRRTKEFDRSNFFGDIFLGILPHHHISMPSNDKFRRQRRMLSDTMSPSFLNEIAGPQIYSSAMDLLELWRLKSTMAKGHPFEAPRDVYKAALDVIWAATFGSAAGTTKSQTQLLSTLSNLDLPKDRDVPVEFPNAPTPPAFDAIFTLTESLEAIISSPIPRLHHWVLRQFPYMRSAKAYKDRAIADGLEQARKRFSSAAEKDESVKSAMDHLLRRELAVAKKEGRAPEYDSPAAKDELFAFLIAGHETTSTTLTWGLKLLTTHQDIQHKLRQLLRNNFSGPAASNTNPSAEEIAKCTIPYLDATLEEILRCAGTAPGQIRVAKVDAEVFGYQIPKGTDVFALTNGPGFLSPPFLVDEKLRSASSREAKDRTGVWETTDIGRFMPERWLRQNEEGQTEFDSRAGPSHPFGLGPRGCFGRKLAELELRMLVVLLVWNFKFLPMPEDLSSYKALDKVTHQPQQCYVRLGPAK